MEKEKEKQQQFKKFFFFVVSCWFIYFYIINSTDFYMTFIGESTINPILVWFCWCLNSQLAFVDKW